MHSMDSQRAIDIFEKLHGNRITVHSVMPGTQPRQIRVTLEANQCRHDDALELLRSMPGIESAEVADQSAAFVIITIAPLSAEQSKTVRDEPEIGT
jgi:hypothetical protein